LGFGIPAAVGELSGYGGEKLLETQNFWKLDVREAA
jgi:hypothetical protein